MIKHSKCALAGAIAMAVGSMATAGTEPYFIPLTQGELVDLADGTKVVEVVEQTDADGNPTGVFVATDNLITLQGVDERNKPWTVPVGITQTNLMSMEEVELGEGSVVRVDNGRNSSMFDMLAFDPEGENIFIPHETTFGAGVSRYNIATDRTDVIFQGDSTGSEGFKNDTDFGAFDPVRFTPRGTLIAGEEWSGTGRFVEICDPYKTPEDPRAPALTAGDCNSDPDADWRVLSGLPLSAQEGIEFSIRRPDEVMYFIDEDRSGSIYKVTFTTPGDYSRGQTSVLSVNSYAKCVQSDGCDPAERWDRGVTAETQRTGAARWIALTDINGNALPGIQNPAENLLDASGDIIDPGFAARVAGDNVGSTPFGRPEDTTISLNRVGNEVIYFTATSENTIYSLEESSRGPILRIFADASTPRNLGFPATNATLNAPDNLALDANGNVYVIEDSPNTTQAGRAGGDIWFARDVNNDGVAESLDHFMSLQVAGSESTGMIFNPAQPNKFVVAVQHPQSTILSDQDESLSSTSEDSDGVRSSLGFGDAIWEFDISGAVAPQ